MFYFESVIDGILQLGKIFIPKILFAETLSLNLKLWSNSDYLNKP